MTAPTARGLFRATGKRHVDTAARPERERREADFYPTPPEPTRALLHAERDRLRTFDGVWEPACGDGAMMREIAAVGLRVVGSDIADRGAGALVRDFFDFDAPLAHAIVTNPPYDRVNCRDGKGAWISHALERLGVGYMALLLSWSWPGAGGLAGLWDRHPPARVYLMRWKIDFTGEGAPPVLNGWFVWDGPTRPGETRLLMLDRDMDARQEALL